MAEHRGYKYSAVDGIITLADLVSGARGDTILVGRDIRKVSVGVTVAAIGVNVVVRLEGTIDNTNWFNLDSTGIDITITVDGTYLLVTEDADILLGVAPYWVSTNGGAPTITALARVR